MMHIEVEWKFLGNINTYLKLETVLLFNSVAMLFKTVLFLGATAAPATLNTDQHLD